MVQHLDYRVIRTLPGGAELRHYPVHWLASIEVPADLEQAGELGFGPLVGYIGGSNDVGQRIAMTAPVLQEARSDVGYSVSFVLPEGMDSHDIPRPRDARITVQEKPEHLYAALQFRGGWQQDRVVGEQQRLLEILRDEGLSVTGPASYARYDPPSVPGIFRRNEILIPVAE